VKNYRLALQHSVAVLWLSLIASHGYSNGIRLEENLTIANELFLANLKVHPYIYDIKVQERLSSWLQHPKNNTYVVDCQIMMRPFFRSPRIIGPLCYLLRQDDPLRRRMALYVVSRYYLEVKAALFELSHDPRYPQEDRTRAQSYFSHFSAPNHDRALSCFDIALTTKYSQNEAIAFTPFSQIARCFHDTLPKINGSPFFAINLAKEFSDHPGHVISPSGWVGGNRITYLSLNDTSPKMAKLLDQRWDNIRQRYPLSGAGSYESMLKTPHHKIFTPEQGFEPVADHPVWNDVPNGLFPALVQGIRDAKESIFIDIFFLGGSMGASLAKYLVQRAEEDIKIFILRDNYNHFGHQPEMLPIYHFLLAYSHHNPTKLAIAASYIKGHFSGLPDILSDIITDEFLEISGLQKHLSLYGRAQSDHSKVFVIDGTSKHPVAFVGSKNLTDSSGPIMYDEFAKVEGPAAAVVLDDYYYDMAYALLYEMPEDYVRRLAQHGWSKQHYQSSQTRQAMIVNILKPFDLLNRNANFSANPQSPIEIAAKGSALIRTGYNNIDSSRTSVVDQNIQAILKAEKNIYIKDQFLFDRNIVLALLKAKDKQPKLEIKIMLDPLPVVVPEGMPNLLYLDILRSAGIEVKWKRLNEEKTRINQEYHMKTISVDGRFLITGSANKDQTTMYGAFREQQLDILDIEATKEHDRTLMLYWNDPKESRPFNGYEFDLPSWVIGPDGQTMTAAQFIAALRNFVAILFDAQTK
jgi:phosphatidylserine/phosphatidylglycerophosphate/cardiolipin synthase-like enzyme